MRGTSVAALLNDCEKRFIPACAGNITGVATMNFMMAVHPRVCGEHDPFCSCTVAIPGSSPRVRGTYLQAESVSPAQRFIPACAGNILFRASPHHFLSVHPRVCGEHLLTVITYPIQFGSSPRVRGTLSGTIVAHGNPRFIPACAGNMIARVSQSVRRTVHPRVCGEHINSIRRIFRRSGSSPRVRGTYLSVTY